MSIAIINKRSVATLQHARVRSQPTDGEYVVIELADGEHGLHFEDAFRFAQLIARQARVAYNRKIALTGNALGPSLRESCGRLV